MRRAASAVVVLAAAVVALLGIGASGGSHKTYNVRAIFDNAAVTVQGEDVRIAGVTVGSIQSLDVTADKRAAVTLGINDSRFVPFYSNATCTIRPQSLIGEKYVDCNPGSSSSPALSKITSGPGNGSYLLPVTRTSSPVESDIVQNIYQEPIRQRFAIILDEFGTALAGRGSDLNDVIHRANPALGYTDQVFQILARQNRQLAQLAKDSDTVLAPLAQDKRAIAGFVTQANTTSVASAARANDISRTFQLFPSFLQQLRPLLVDLGNLADQGTTLNRELAPGAAALGRQFTNLTPFASAARKSLIDLGSSAQQSEPALIATEPLARQLLRLGNTTEPTAQLLDKLTGSLDRSGAIEQLMSLLFYGTSAGNGFDSAGHYVRTETLVGSCTPFSTTPTAICSSNFAKSSGAAADVTNAPRAPQTASGTAKPAPAPQAAVEAVKKVGQQPASQALNGLLGYLLGSRK
jgi:phospholipid/cholesterol/gamma-HCH transport system substrate-binding protein